MAALEDYAFLRLLKKIEKENYTPNLGERAILCRTFNSTFNPIGLYFAFVGAICGFLCTSYVRKPFGRTSSALLGSLYSFEVSWILQDNRPCFTFFNDIQSINGDLREKASEYRLSGYLNHNQRPLLSFIFDFLTCHKTWKWLNSSVFTSAGHIRWLHYLRIEWFDGLPLDPFTMWYWRFALPRNTLK